MPKPERNKPTGYTQEPSWNVNFKVSGTVIGLTIVLDVVYGLLSQSGPQTLLFVTATAAAAGAILAAYYTGRALCSQIESADQMRELQSKRLAHQIAARWNDPSMLKARKTCREIVDVKSQGHEAIIERVKSNELTDDIIHLLNFLEEVAIAEASNIADEAMLRDFYEELVHQVWKTLEPWITFYRASRGTPKLWDAFENLHKKWAHASMREMQPVMSANEISRRRSMESL